MKTLRAILETFYRAWMAEHPARQAAALAYYGMFAFAPILYVVLKVAGLFVSELFLAQGFYSLIAQLLGVEMAEFVRDLVLGASLQWAGVSLISTLVSLGALLYAATGLFNHLRYALNTIWHADPKTQSGGVILHLRVSSAGSAFEAAGSLAVLLIGIYYVAQIFLAGALFTRVLASSSFSERKQIGHG